MDSYEKRNTIHVYICMHVYMYVCMYVCIYIYIIDCQLSSVVTDLSCSTYFVLSTFIFLFENFNKILVYIYIFFFISVKCDIYNLIVHVNFSCFFYLHAISVLYIEISSPIFIAQLSVSCMSFNKQKMNTFVNRVHAI